MELPHQGRTTIIEDFDGVELITPARKNTALIAFLSLWLCGWLFGEVMVSYSLITGNLLGAPDKFMLVWICGWTVGGAIAIRVFWWMIFGKEIVKAGQGTITITKKGAFFIKPKTYDIREAKNFRIQYTSNGDGNLWGDNRAKGNALKIADAGTIRFDYGMETIKFAEDVNETEAAYLLKKLRDKKTLTDKNFEPNNQPF